MSRIIPAIAEANAVLTEFGRSRFVGASVKWNHQDEQRCVSQRSSLIVNRNERVSVDPQNIGVMELPRTRPLAAVQPKFCELVAGMVPGE